MILFPGCAAVTDYRGIFSAAPVESAPLLHVIHVSDMRRTSARHIKLFVYIVLQLPRVDHCVIVLIVLLH